jgi:hypothetical protein
LSQAEAVLPVNTVGVHINFIQLPDDMTRMSGFGGENARIMELEIVSQADAVLCQS